jgi:hypothetical protein
MVTKKFPILILAATLLVIPSLSSVAAEQPSSAAQLAALRTSLGARKSAIALETLELNSADAAVFKKIYSGYKLKLGKLTDERIAIIGDFVADLVTISNEKASELIAESFNYQKSRIALIEETTNKVSAELSPIVAGRYYQIENQLLGMIDTELSQNLPLVPKNVAQDFIQ